MAWLRTRALSGTDKSANKSSLNLSPDGRLRADDGLNESRRLRQELQFLSDHEHDRPSLAAWYLVDPASPYVAMWDMVTALTLLVVLGFTPFEVAFLESPTTASSPVFILGRVIDAVFAIDMALQFFTMVPKVGEPGKLETRHSVIVGEYLRGWFVLDLFSLGASIFDFIPLYPEAFGDAGGSVGGGDGGEDGAGTSQTKKSPLAFLRVVRALRLVKLIRLLRASRRLKEWSVKIATPRATLVMCQTVAECFFVTHMFACVLGVMTIVSDSPLDTWYATHGYCGFAGIDAFGERAYECVGPVDLYFQCIWWSAGMLMGAPISLTPNPGPYEPYFSNDATNLQDKEAASGVERMRTKLTLEEQIVVLVLKSVTALFWVTVIARVVQVYNDLDPGSAEPYPYP